jgi:hypothetical protein
MSVAYVDGWLESKHTASLVEALPVVLVELTARVRKKAHRSAQVLRKGTIQFKVHIWVLHTTSTCCYDELNSVLGSQRDRNSSVCTQLLQERPNTAKVTTKNLHQEYGYRQVRIHMFGTFLCFWSQSCLCWRATLYRDVLLKLGELEHRM